MANDDSRGVTGSDGPKPSVAPVMYVNTNDALRAPLTVLALLVPIGLLAELLRAAGSAARDPVRQTLSDPLLSSLGQFFGLDRPWLAVALLAVGGLIVHVAGRYSWKPPALRILALAFVWGFIWMVVRVAIGLASRQLHPDGLLGDGGLVVAGALQEELLFRAVILGGLLVMFGVLDMVDWVRYPLALGLSAAFFSLAHTGIVNHHPGAELFAWPTFIERALAGALYGYVFIRQGLAVCTLAHAGYNVALLMGLSKYV